MKSTLQRKRSRRRRKAGSRGPSPSPSQGPNQSPTHGGSTHPGLAHSGPVVGLGGGVQARLEVGSPGGALERQADSVADRVTTGRPAGDISPVTPAGLGGGAAQRMGEGEGEEAPTLQRTEGDEEAQTLQRMDDGDEAQTLQRTEGDEEAQTVQRMDEGEEAQTLQRKDEEEAQARSASSKGPRVTPRLESQLRRRGEGVPLPESLRAEYEPRFGHDFSDVRLHTGSRAREMSDTLNAQAFTHGSDIYFAPGKLDLQSQAGRHLLGHELTHVVQQGKARPAGTSTAPGTSRAGGGSRGAAQTVQREADDDVPTEAQKAAAEAAAAKAEREAERRYQESQRQIEEEKARSQAEREAKAEAGNEKQSAVAASASVAESAEAKLAAGEEGAGKGDEGEGKAAQEGKAEGKAKSKAEKGRAGKKRAAGGPGEAGAVDAAPKSPDEDPAFRAVVGRAGTTAKQQSHHVPARKKADDARAAAESPEAELKGQAQDAQLGTMEEAEEPPFDKAGFKARLKERIEAMTPKTTQEADELKESGKVESVGTAAKAEAAKEKEKVQGPSAEATAAEPDPATATPKPVAPLQPPDAGPAPGPLGAAGAAPKTRTKAEVEAPLEQESAEVGSKMDEAGVTEEQLAKSNEPQFQEALGAKKEVETHAVEAPQQFRPQESEQLASAQNQAAAVAREKTAAMHGERQTLQGQVAGEQGKAKGADEAKRAEVAKEIDAIFGATKTKVTEILGKLDEEVATAFDKGAADARQSFESYVDAKMTAYKERRYGGWLGWARWLDDKWSGMPSEVNVFYSEGRRRYLQQMDRVIDTVVEIIGRRLTEAKAEIALGKKKVKDYVAGLPADLQKLGAQAADDVQSKFDELEQSVTDKENQLVDDLASKYSEQLKAVDARITEMKEANKGLKQKAIEAVEGAIQAIEELKDLLFRVLAKVADVVGDIIADPIGFLSNLISAINQGFESFVGRIWKHLKNALVGWLTGALGPVNVKVPEDVFSFKGVVSLVVQVLGLTWENVRKRAAKIIPEPVLKGLETSFEVFKILITEGPGGLWKWVQAEISDLKEQVIDGIQQMVITQVIEAGVKWVLGLLTPAGAFIKAAKAIYDIVTFFVQKAKQILTLVESIVDSVAAVAKGSLGKAAEMVENALARALPLVIGFLANLLSLGDLPKRVQRIIERVRKPINRMIDKLLLKAKKFGGKLVAKGKAAAGKVFAWWKAKKKFKLGKESHTLFFEGGETNAVLNVASKKRVLEDYLATKSVNASPGDKKIITQIKGLATQIYNKKHTKRKGKVEPASIGQKRGEEITKLLSRIAGLMAQLPGSAEETIKPPTKVTWTTRETTLEDKTKSVDGASMVASPLSLEGGENSGSEPFDETPLWNSLRTRPGAYVRGHLLNHHVHGSGKKENLTPIPGADNTKMESKYESKVKDAVLNQGEVVRYEVTVNGRQRTKRTHLPDERRIAKSLTLTAHKMKLKKQFKGDVAKAKLPSSWRKSTKIVKGTLSITLPADTAVGKEPTVKRVSLQDPVDSKLGKKRSREIVVSYLQKVPGIGGKRAYAILDAAPANTEALMDVTDDRGVFVTDDIAKALSSRKVFFTGDTEIEPA